MAKSYKNFSHQLKNYIQEYNDIPGAKHRDYVDHYIDDIDATEYLQTEEYQKKLNVKRKREML